MEVPLVGGCLVVEFLCSYYTAWIKISVSLATGGVSLCRYQWTYGAIRIWEPKFFHQSHVSWAISSEHCTTSANSLWLMIAKMCVFRDKVSAKGRFGSIYWTYFFEWPVGRKKGVLPLGLLFILHASWVFNNSSKLQIRLDLCLLFFIENFWQFTTCLCVVYRNWETCGNPFLSMDDFRNVHLGNLLSQCPSMLSISVCSRGWHGICVSLELLLWKWRKTVFYLARSSSLVPQIR